MIKKFSIPDYYGKCHQIADLINYKNEHPDFFYSDRIIDNSYGAPPYFLWMGGRLTYPNGVNSMDTVLYTLPSLELRHVCTNCLVNDEVIHDYRSNKFIRDYVRPQDKLIVSHPSLIQYLKKNYPYLTLVYSTTMNITNVNKINEMTENNIYVLNYNYNYDDKYIKQLKNPHNIEILCGESCDLECPNRMHHYKFISEAVLGIATQDFNCPNGCDARSGYEIIHLPHAITNERIDELSEMGIQYFKISGRTLNAPDWIYVIAYYLVLPEHRE